MVSKISTSIIVSFPQLLHIMEHFFYYSFYIIFPWIPPTFNLKHWIFFKNDGNRLLYLSILSAVNFMISIKGNQLRLSFIIFGQYSVLSLRSIFFLIDGHFTSLYRFFSYAASSRFCFYSSINI